MYLVKSVSPSSLPQGDIMKEQAKSRNEEPKARTINLPTWLWDLAEKDADRCKRSITKQIEAILTCYYDPTANVELSRQALTEAFDVVSKERMTA